MRAIALGVAVVAAVVCLGVRVSGHVGFEMEAINTNVERASIPWWRKIISPKGYAMHTVANQWKLTVDHTFDAEYVTDAADESLAGRLQTCARLAAVSADANVALLAHNAAIGAPGAGANAVWAHHAHNLRGNPHALALQSTFGVQLGHVRRMLAAMHDANWALPLAPNPEWYTPFMAASALWGAAPLNQLSEEMRGFVLLVAAMRAAGNSGDPDSPKKHMDFIVHTKWARIANELTANILPIGMAGPGVGALVTERAALLANGPGGRPWCSILAELLVNDALVNHVWASQMLVWNPAGALAADMFAQGWTVWGMNMDPGFDVWVRGILTPSVLPGVYATDYLRNNPLTYFANTIGNMDAVDTVGGQPHIIIEMRKGFLVTHANVQEVGLALYDWFTRWNAWALAGAGANQPRRLMSVSPAAVAPGAPPFYATVGVGCAVAIQNTCQAGGHLGGTLAALHAAILGAENNRVGGVGAPACLLEHDHALDHAKGQGKRLRRKMRAHKQQHTRTTDAHVMDADAAAAAGVSESQCVVVPAARAWPVWPQPPQPPQPPAPATKAVPNPQTSRVEPQHGRTVADVLRDNAAELKAHADQLPKDVADALKWAQEHEKDPALHKAPTPQHKK